MVAGRTGSGSRLSSGTEIEVHGKERPADVFLSCRSGDQDAAVDLTMVHSLKASQPWDPNASAATRAEEAKLVCACLGLWGPRSSLSDDPGGC